MDDELFARAVATALGALWAMHLKERDQMKALAYADIFLENIDQLTSEPERGDPGLARSLLSKGRK